MSTPVAIDIDEIQGRYAVLDGYTVGFETFKRDGDPAPLFAGLPDDRCQCPHWGVVTAGRLTFRWPDRDETHRAGDAYYASPGHLPLMIAGTTVVEFSPTAEFETTAAAIRRNLLAAGATS
jgi:hypothetical protein